MYAVTRLKMEPISNMYAIQVSPNSHVWLIYLASQSGMYGKCNGAQGWLTIFYHYYSRGYTKTEKLTWEMCNVYSVIGKCTLIWKSFKTSLCSRLAYYYYYYYCQFQPILVCKFSISNLHTATETIKSVRRLVPNSDPNIPIVTYAYPLHSSCRMQCMCIRLDLQLKVGSEPPEPRYNST